MDFERLRDDLRDYFGTAMQFFPAAVIDLSEVDTASNEKLIDIASSCGFDLSEYEVKRR